MTRDEVFTLIDGERKYQKRIWVQRCQEFGIEFTPDSENAIEDWLVFLQGYYNDAIQVASHIVDGQGTLDIMRKLAGLCVACMEVHGGWENAGPFSTFRPGPLERCLTYHYISCECAYNPPLYSYKAERLRSINAYLVEIGLALNECARFVNVEGGLTTTLQYILTVASIAVQCMEDHGAPPREMSCSGP